MHWNLWQSSSPRLCCGDFNEILYLRKKKRGNNRDVGMTNEFREVVQDSRFIDMGFSRRLFTCSNKRYRQ